MDDGEDYIYAFDVEKDFIDKGKKFIVRNTKRKSLNEIIHYEVW